MCGVEAHILLVGHPMECILLQLEQLSDRLYVRRVTIDPSRTDGTYTQEDSVQASDSEERRQDVAHLYFQRLQPNADPALIISLNGKPHTLGRTASSDGADTQFNDQKISKQHAVIKRTSLGWSVMDLESRNGTFVEGQPAPAKQRVPLSDGSLIRFGDSLVVFRFGDVPKPTASHRMLPGDSPAMLRTRKRLEQVGPLRIPVLILGETGTGKEYAARAIHAAGNLPTDQFIAVNCGELSKSLSRAELFGTERGAFTDAKEARAGLIAAANGGTLFLDEIGELPLEVQVELLRFLEEQTYRSIGGTKLKRSSARVVAATHVDLADAVAAKRFRQDLYARLKAIVSPIRMPPLHQRQEDIVPWAFRFMVSAGPLLNVSPKPISAGFAEALILHGWPDNLRALRGAIGAALLAAPEREQLIAADLPEEVLQERIQAREGAQPVLPKQIPAIKPIDRHALVEALNAEKGVMKKVAERLSLDRRKLYRLCEEFELSPDDFRQS